MAFLKPTHLVAVVAAAFLLSACGGSSSNSKVSYKGKTTPAAFSSLTESQQISVSNESYDAIDEAIAVQNLADGFPFAASSNLNSSQQQPVINKALAIAKSAKAKSSHSLNLPIGAKNSETVACELGGTETYSFSGNDDKGTFSVKYKNCKEEYGPNEYDILNGEMKLVYKSGSIEITFNKLSTKDYENGVLVDDFTISGYYKIKGIDWDDFGDDSANYTAEWSLRGTENGKAISSNGTLTCKLSTCSIASVIQTADGKIYKVENLDIEHGYYYDEYEATGTLYHPDHGYYKFTIESEWECDDSDPAPFVGKVVLDSQDSIITYESTSCSSEPTVTLELK